jgi:hypothetical protein
MFGVAMPAAKVWIIVQHFAVHGCDILHFGCDLAMTHCTTLCHIF